MRTIYKTKGCLNIKALMFESMYEYIDHYRSFTSDNDLRRKERLLNEVHMSSFDEAIQKMYCTDGITAKDKKEIFNVCAKEIKRPVKTVVGSTVSVPLALQGVPKCMYKRSKVEHPLKRIYFHNNIDWSYSNARLKETMLEEINSTLTYVQQGIDTEIYFVSSNVCGFSDKGQYIDRLTFLIPLKRFGQPLNIGRMLGPCSTDVFIRGLLLPIEVTEGHGSVGVDHRWRETIQALNLGYDGVCVG
jgi:hypothetical protein